MEIRNDLDNHEENKIIENKIIENKITENEIIENEIIENKITENEITENKITENKITENKITENKIIENKDTENKAIENNIITNNNITNNPQLESDNNNKDNKINIIKEKKQNEYILKIKNYLNTVHQNIEYKKLIINNPEKLFSFLKEEVFIKWQSIVFNMMPTIIESDADIIALVPNRKDQQLIEVDTKRTRFLESNLVPGFVKILEMVLTFYCNTKNIKYKQGLNEIFGPLILMKYKIKQLKYINIFNFGEAFIDKFLPNYYYETELYSIKSSISIFTLLLKYHEPSVYNFLDSLEIPHELYAANWLLTLRAGKLNLDILYFLFDILIQINDPLFIHYILVALIIYYRELLINCDSNLLVKLMTGLTITSKEELDIIIKLAIDLRNRTPYSFRLLSNKIGFLKTNNKNISINFQKYKPELFQTLPIYPLEILHGNNKDIVLCPDPECKNNLKNKIIKIDWKKNDVLNNNINNNYICEQCNMKINKDFNFVLLDLRLFPPSFFLNEDDYFKLGFISGMMAIDKDELQSDDIDKILSSNLLEIRGKMHIVLMTSRTDYFNKFEEKFYSDNTSNIEKRKKLFGMIETQKKEKKLNLSDAKNLNLEEIYKLKEYDNFRKVLNSMKKKNFPYVGYLEGGFEALHDECINYKIELIGHEKKKCILCNIKKAKRHSKKEVRIDKLSNSLWKRQKILNENQLDSFFTNENNVVLLCSLRKYKKKIYHDKNFELFVAILFDKGTIEIYKKDVKNENYIYNSNDLENHNNPNYYNLGIKNEKNKKNFELKLLEAIKFRDLIQVSFNHEIKNIIMIEVKKKDTKEDNLKIELDFYSVNDSKLFMKSLKKSI